VSKFQNDPTVNKSKIVILLDRFECMEEKERILGNEEERTNLGGKEINSNIICLYL